MNLVNVCMCCVTHDIVSRQRINIININKSIHCIYNMYINQYIVNVDKFVDICCHITIKVRNSRYFRHHLVNERNGGAFLCIG